MLASLEAPALQGDDLVYEPKYDGIRALVHVEGAEVSIWSRLGNDKTSQFPDIARDLAARGRRWKRPVMLDGEIVALDARGHPAGFQRLQNRIHVTRAREQPVPTALIAFDLLRDGDEDLRGLPLAERRARLEALVPRPGSTVRLSEVVAGDGRALFETARREGWEGLIVKRAGSPYRSGQRTHDWRKLKLVTRQECVIGGWTEPRGSRHFFGALLLGVYDTAGRLVYVGNTGTGFSERELEHVWSRLAPLGTTRSPFSVRPRPDERPHWVEPRLVAEVRFTEWTTGGRMRHPVYGGLRDDKAPQEVRREDWTGATRASAIPATSDAAAGSAHDRVSPPHDTRQRAARPSPAHRTTAPAPRTRDVIDLLDVLSDLERSRRDGTLELPGGTRMAVSNLHKVFWPNAKLTKGDLLRFYVQVAPVLLPAVADRPLVMRRFPNGVDRPAFYQQTAPVGVPAGVRVESIPGETQVPGRLVGGSLATLVYMAQIAAISQDPWCSRVQSPEVADYAAIDLDPADDVPFARVLDVARAVHEELERLGAPAVPKTSGATGLHICIPLPAGTPYDAGLLFCQIVATVVAHRHPQLATVERAVRARGRRVYVDYLQNVRGRTLATAYSARASDFAGVSAPLTWTEVEDGVDRREFTLKTMPGRVKQVGDLWARMRTGPKANLRAVERYLKPVAGGL